LRVSAPSFESPAPSAPAIAEGASIERLSLQAALPTGAEKPMVLDNLQVRGAQIGIAYVKPAQDPAILRAMNALQWALADDKPAAAGQPARMLIRNLKVEAGQMELRGPDG